MRNELAGKDSTNERRVALVMPTQFRCLLVEEGQTAETTAKSVQVFPVSRLDDQKALRESDAHVLIQVEFSSLNYKDALAASGHKGVIKKLPHVPGIDCAGTVFESNDPSIQVGDSVLVTGYDLGQGHWGGWSELVKVPADWVVPLPTDLTTREAMLLGTAGFTAAQCVDALLRNGMQPDDGEVVVTGATGGVGSIALRLLAKLGFSVVAVTGKTPRHSDLMELGAIRVVSREEIVSESQRPLLSASWAGGVDTVGGELLNSILRSTQYGGTVTACGLVAGEELNMTVYPFLLRGINLCGIASAECPRDHRLKIWGNLADKWKLDNLEHAKFCTEVALAELPNKVQDILAGHIIGRTLVRPNI